MSTTDLASFCLFNQTASVSLNRQYTNVHGSAALGQLEKQPGLPSPLWVRHALLVWEAARRCDCS